MPILFGTGGLRGIMGDGGDNMNERTIAHATRGLANCLLDTDGARAREMGVAIAFDTRLHSQFFAEVAAAVLEAAGIPAYMFANPTPTPTLSFAVRHMGCSAGIVITASHNPKEYNGYKVYNHHGCQLVPSEAAIVSAYIAQAEEGAAPLLPEIRFVPEAVADAYMAAVAGQSLLDDAQAKRALKVVYTPLHGTGDWFVRKALAQDGFADVSPVAVQQTPDGSFPTVRSPNPEERDALTMAIRQAQAEGAALVLGTDPDCDRVGAAVQHGDSYQLITGNQMGALLMDFILSRKALPQNGAVVKTIVTNDLGAKLARGAGLTVYETLTGFKYIGEKMTQFAKSGEHSFVFGYEESYGYLVGDYARDKDAVVASLLICEMAAWHLAQGRTLVDALNALYEAHGVYLDALDSIAITDMTRTQAILQKLRRAGGDAFDKPARVQDFAQGLDGLPKENVLKFRWPNGSWLAVRPSGTEPKLKVYYAVTDATMEGAQTKIKALRAQVARYTNEE